MPAARGRSGASHPWRHRDHPRRPRDRRRRARPPAPTGRDARGLLRHLARAYKHWTLSVDGEVATLTLDVAEDGGIVPGYELKMNSYDLGVDIELHDAVQRIRFEHPEVKAVVVTSGKDRMFCAGANIKMLAASPHSWKVNFCKFTNETRNGIEDASAHSGLPFIAAVNGTAAGGGYELALACDQIVLVDDNSSAVSLPEVPLLGVLPGTGGLTRVVDKRGVRRDLADVFSTTAEGIRGDRAVQWRLVDGIAKARDFADEIARRAAEAAADVVPAGRRRAGRGAHPAAAARSTATPPATSTCGSSSTATSGTATITVLGPTAVPGERRGAARAGRRAWLLAMTRELDDADPPAAHQRADARHLAAAHRGRRRHRRRLRRVPARPPRRLAGQRDDRLLQAHREAAGHHLAAACSR